MRAPDSFVLELVKQGLHLPPTPPLYFKQHIYTNLNVFKAIDAHAIQESRQHYDNFRDLVWNLSYKRNFSELERARAIFRWLTCVDLTKIHFRDEKPGSPEQLLSAFKTGKATYARIFECMARHSGLSCHTICGWAKGVDYRPGVALTSQPINHSWNGIYIDGNWQLVDCHWATRFLQSEQNIPENLVYEYDDFYFLTEPEQLSYTHYPENAAWLLLESPISKEKFEGYPLIKSYFFTTGMYLLPECSRGVISTKHGITAIALGLANQTTFTFKLGYGDSMVEKLGDVELSNYSVQETKDDQVVYYLRLPKKGDYYMIIFANLVPDAPETAEGTYKAICEYKIVCDEPAKAEPVAFPVCSDVSWGPDALVSQHGLMPNNHEAILLAPNGHTEVVFDRMGDVRVYARLVKAGVSDGDLKKALAVRNEDGKVSVLVDLPQEGEYGLEIFANDPDKDGDMFTHVCQYLCSYTKDPPLITYGKVPDVVKQKARRPLDPSLEDRALYKPLHQAGDAFDAALPAHYMMDIYRSEQKSTSPEKILAQRVEEPEHEYKPHSSDVYTSEIDVKPPEHFEAIKIKNEEKAPEPEAALPTQKIFKDTNVFKDIDTHAVEVSKQEHKSFRDILWHLIYAREITNDLDRARAIFLWLCSKDLIALNFTDYDKGSPEETLMNLKNGQTTYARVYETLCSYANLHCKTLTGYAKGAEYKPGMKFVGQQGQHSWNAVLVNGSWQLVDCHWAARRLVGKKDYVIQLTSDNVRYELDEYYFMPAPSQLIFSHFPEHPTWQLVEKSLTREEFEDLVPVKPTFFKYGLQLLSHTDAIIKADNDVNIRIDCPQNKAKSLRFTFNVTYDDGREEYQGIKLNRYGMQEVVGNICFLTFRPPEKGSYQLVLYAKDLDNQAKEGVYAGICEYKIVCDENLGRQPFPPCVHTTWGAGDSAPKFDLVPLQKGAIVNTVDGLAEVKFGLDPNVRLRFMAKLKSNSSKDDKALAPYTMYRTVNDMVIFRVAAPSVGEFGLEIYANNPELGGNTLQHVYQYLVVAKEVPERVEQFPTLNTGFLGPQTGYAQLGLTTVDQKDPFIQTSSGDLTVSFGMTQPLRVTSQLIFVSNGANRDCSEYILQQGSQSGVTFVIKLTEKGMYKFQVFAAPQSAAAESLPGVYNYLVDCRGTVANGVPFPKQFGPWKEGCYLYEPLEGHLQPNRSSMGSASSNKHIYFSMEVPKAVNVSIIIGTEWTQLEQKKPGSWEGEVFMEKHWEKERKVSVCANFSTAGTSYSTLLEYSM